MISAKTTGFAALFLGGDGEWKSSMGFAKCRENNMIVANVAAQSRNINHRGSRVRKGRKASRPLHTDVALMSCDEDIENKEQEHKIRGQIESV